MKIKIKQRLSIFFSLFFVILISIFLLNKSYSKVEIDKLDKVINWDDKDFYKDALVNIEIAKQIKKEAKRRKELRDQGVPDKEIKEIIKRERKSGINEKNTNNNIDNDSNTANNTGDEVILSSPNQHMKDIGTNLTNEESKENISDSNNQKKHYIEDYFNNINDEDEYIIIKKRHKNNSNQNNMQYNKITNYSYDAENINEYKDNNDGLSYNNNQQNYNSINYNEEDLTPEIPLLSSDIKKKLNKNDYKLLKMMEKVGENMYDKDQFELFAKELGRLARQPLEIKQRDNIIENNDYKKQSYSHNLQTTLTNKNLIASKEQKHNFYANSNSIKNDKIKDIKKPKKSLNMQKVYAYTAKKNNDQTKENLIDRFINKENQEDIDYEYLNNIKNNISSSDNLKLKQTTLTEKQIKAKELGSPTPVLRNKKNYKTQIQPQNISQIQYDKNNQHLEPAVFQSQITNNVFSHLSDNNAIEIAKAIINQNGYVDITDEKNNTLLMHAVALQNQSLITMLLAEGANPNYINDEGFSPLHLASTNGDNTSLYYLLLSGGNPNLKDGHGITSFMYCAIACNLSTIKMMVSMGANLNEINEISKKSIIDYAVMNKNKDVLDYLTTEMGYMIKKREKSKDLTKL